MSLDLPHKNSPGRVEWVMTEPRHAQELAKFSSNPDLKIVLSTDPADASKDAEITELRLYAPETDRLTHFPERVSMLRNLRSLAMGPSIDATMLSHITQESIPRSVTAITVFTSGAAAVWPHDVPMPNVTDLRADGPLALAPGDFPNLKAVSLEPARNGKNLDTVLACKDLSEIQLRTVPGNDVFARMKHLPLAKLGLLGGKMETLQGIEVLAGIRWLRLHNLRSFKSISAIVALRQLEELEIRYCKKIEDITCLAQLPNLRRLQVVACGNIGLSKIKSTLEKLNEVMISASS